MSKNVIDVHLGERIRLRRQLLEMSSAALGQRLGVSVQQIQKYETGSNRLSAVFLYRLSDVLDVPIGFFFDGLPGRPPQSMSLSAGSETFSPLWVRYQSLPPLPARQGGGADSGLVGGGRRMVIPSPPIPRPSRCRPSSCRRVTFRRRGGEASAQCRRWRYAASSLSSA